MSDLPRHAVTRTARLARLPAGFAGRTALGTGRRLGGRPAELVAQEIQQRTAEQVFRVLGELKGGALKLGQALSVFEAAMPPEIAGPYRATLTRYRSEFRYGSLAREVRLPATVGAADVTARYDKGVLEVSVPVRVVKPEGTRIPIENADAMSEQPPDQAG